MTKPYREAEPPLSLTDDLKKILRKQAEEIVAKTEAAENLAVRTPGDTASLIHELRIHQAELELQNQALQRLVRQLEAARYREVVEDQTEVISRFNADGEFTFVNDVYCRFFGQTEAELIGQKWRPVAVAEDLPIIEEKLQTISPSNPVVVIENRVYAGDGRIHWMQFVNRAFFDERGRLLEIQSVGRDITERKQAQAALGQSEERVALLLHNAPVAIVIHGADGRILHSNEVARQLLDLSEEDARGKYLDDKAWQFLRENRTPMPVEEYPVSRVLAQGAPVKNLVMGLPRSTRSDLRWILVNAVPRFVEGAIAEIIVSFMDITERKLTEEELKIYREQLEDLVQERTRELEAEIIERKWAEQKLLESEERLLLVMEGSQLGYWDWNIQTGEVQRNARWAEMLGYTLPEIELNVKQWTDLHHPDDQAAAWQSIQDHLDGRTPAHRIEYRMRCKNGEYKWILDQARVVKRDAQGKPVRMSGTHTDITERKQAEEALRKSEERFQQIFANMSSGVAVYEAEEDCNDFIFKDFNQAAQRIEHIARQDVIGKKITKVFPGVAEFGLLDVLKRVWQTDLPEHQPASYYEDPRISGWRDNYVYKLPSGEIVCIYDDITERKLAEDQLRRQAAILATLLNSPQETVALLDTDGNVLTINQNGAKRFGLLPEEMVGQNIYTLLPEPVSSQRKKIINNVMQTGQFAYFEDERQNMYYMNSVYPVNDPQSCELLGVAIFASDITSRKLMEEALQQSNRRLEDALAELRETQEQMLHQERLAAVGQLAGGIAHDFNNIMAIITLYSEITMSSSHLAQQERERVAIIHEQAWRASHLVQQILDFSRKAMLQMQPINLLSLLQDQVGMLARMLPEHIRIQLICEPHGDRYMVSADQTRMQQMISNLAINARDAMPQGGKLNIELKQINIEPGQKTSMPDLEPGAWLQLSVADTGTGIPPEVLPHIFEPFYSTKGPGAGSGLGLAQVYGIIGQHGGHIDVKTWLGQGTTFTIYLPALTTNPVRPSSSGPSNIPFGHGEFVLVVEDNTILRETLAEILRGLNYRVGEAMNGLEALAQLAEMGDQVDLVLSDVIMPEMGGQELFLTMKAMGQPAPVVLLSGHTLDKTLDELEEQGLAAWLTKPPSLESLANALAKALRR